MMNKKLMSTLLFSAALLSAGVVTSCKDYDDDIDELRELINQNATLGETLQTQLNTLQSAAQAAQTTADQAVADAKTAADAAAKAQAAADAAQSRGDEAAAAAATAQAEAEQAKADAAAALAAAEQAKADAIAAAAADLEAYKAEVEGLLANKADVSAVTTLEGQLKALGSELEGELAELTGRIEGIETGLADEITSALDVRITSNTNEIRNIQDLLATLTAGATDLEVQKATLEQYATLLSENGLQADITELNQDILAVNERIDDTVVDIKTLKTDVATNKTDIATAKADIKTLQGDVADIRTDINDINSNLSQLHILVTARLTSITFAPDYIVDGVEAIVFNSLEYGDMKNVAEDTDVKDAKLDIDFSTASLAKARYHFNPASFDFEKNATYQYIDRQAEVITTRANVAATKLLEIEGDPVANVEKGTVDFSLRRLNTTENSDDNGDKVNLVALQATLQGAAIDEDETGAVVTSPYVRVYDDIVTQGDLFISDNEDGDMVKQADAAHFPTTVSGAQKDAARYEVIYDKEFNLKELIGTCLKKEKENTHSEFKTDDYKLSYRFAVATTKYNIPTDETITNQQTVIECTDEEAGLYKVSDEILKEAIGRTPILRVELVDEAGRVVRRAFVKVKIVAEKAADIMTGITKELTFGCADDDSVYVLNEEWMRANVYRRIESSRGDVSMSHEQFWNTYEVGNIKATVNGVENSTLTHDLKVVDGDGSVGTATKKIVWTVNHGAIGKIGEAATLVGTVTLKNKLESSEYPAKVELFITVHATLPDVSDHVATKIPVYWDETQTYFKANVNEPNSETDDATNCQFETPMANAFKSIVFNNEDVLTDCRDEYYRVVSVWSGDKELITDGVFIDGITQMLRLDKSDAIIKEALNSKDGLQAILQYVVRFDNGDIKVVEEFPVSFITPLTLNMPSDLAVTDAETGGDEVDFGGYQMLVDWRGYPVTSPETTQQLVRKGFWLHNWKAHETIVIPGWTEVLKAPEWVVEFEEVILPIGKTVYNGTANVTYTWKRRVSIGSPESGKYVWEYEITTDNECCKITGLTSEADVEAMMKVQALNAQYKNKPNGINWELVGEPELTNVNITSEVTVQETAVKVIKSMEYIAGEYKTYEPVIQTKPCSVVKPNYEGKDGEVVGCWQWIGKEQYKPVTTPGAFWDFYGPFGKLFLDTENAYTDEEAGLQGDLPSDVTLIQTGTSVKYINTGSPVGYSYKIHIPASIDYGWGTAKAELILTVNPAGTGK